LIEVTGPAHVSACWLPTDAQKRQKLRDDRLAIEAASTAN